MYLKPILLSIGLIGIAFAGIAVKMFFIKGAEFKKSCSSAGAGGQKIGCACGGEGSCERSSLKDHDHHDHQH